MVGEGTVSLPEMVRGLFRYRWKIVAALTVLGALAALLLALVQTPKYTARTSLVIGGIDLPTSLANAVDPKRSGPLGADLAADTQVRIMASTLISNEVTSALNLEPDAGAVMAGSVRAKALTNDAYVITVEGPTAVAAVAYANEYASAYLAYRQAAARDLLRQLADQNRASSRSALAAAAVLQSTLDSDFAKKRDGDAATVRSSQQQLLSEARADDIMARQLEGVSQVYNGGGKVIAPAVSAQATKSPRLLRDIVFGGLVGFLVGLTIAIVLEKSTDRVRTRRDAAQAAQAPVVMSIRASGRGPSPNQLVREAELAVNRLQLASGNPGEVTAVAVRSLRRSPYDAWIALALAEAMDRGSHRTMVRGFDARADSTVDQARSEWVSRWTHDEPTISERTTFGPSSDRTGVLEGPGVVVSLTVPHATDGGPTMWPSAGTPVLLVVDANRDHLTELRRVACDLRLAGLPVVGVALVGAQADDHSLGEVQRRGSMKDLHSGQSVADAPVEAAPADSRRPASTALVSREE